MVIKVIVEQRSTRRAARGVDRTARFLVEDEIRRSNCSTEVWLLIDSKWLWPRIEVRFF